MSQTSILVVEDDPTLCEALCDTLEIGGYMVKTAADGKAALGVLEQYPVSMIVSDVQMRPMDGHRLLQKVKSQFPSIPVLLMTAYGSVDKAVIAMRDGAVDYLVKPFEAEALLEKVNSAIVPRVADALSMVAEDVRTREILELAQRVAPSEATVMIGGESGTGKEVIARYIHSCSPRAEEPFVALNCAAIPENMLEAVLFGYEKGAFTGAYRMAPGKFEQAEGGTLLLDEISEMSLALQAKLLRVLQEREVERLGGRKLIQLNVRVLATSNRILREEVAAGRFREDLFYRLNVFPLVLPPLRERPRDILPLAGLFMQRHLQRCGLAPIVSPEAQQQLLSHSWPGNVRELDNVMQRALILRSGNEITPDDLCFEVDNHAAAPAKPVVGSGLTEDLKSVEEQMILDALQSGNCSRKDVAEKLGISQRTLRYKIARLREAGVAIP
ncbi:Flagellar two-component response regulator FleR [hydrothermal vent metagenome]|uniref:Flagellar two-component response regulator FleR n=1 Tax=hydrothermal vent metagenome TaxID=652676 RepID=A0A3B1AQ39_9ZZZZ